MDKVADLFKNGGTPEQALELFDSLAPVEISFMSGRWKGSELPTGHKMDGLLRASGWYGKMVMDKDHVHPLLFYTSDKKGLFAVNPKLIPLKFTLYPRDSLLGTTVQMARPLLETKDAKARLRKVEYRGTSTACMVYDDKPIIDCFRRLNGHAVMGAMDLKGMAKPYFFLLERDEATYQLEF